MKLLITGDWHITDKKPKNRLDKNYYLTQKDKINWIFNKAMEEKCEVILQPGDFFDSYRANDLLKQTIISLILLKGVKIYTIYGQHDKYYHSDDTDNVPLRVLKEAKAIGILQKTPLVYSGNLGVVFYGASWGEKIPEIQDPSVFNILVIHTMIIKDEKIWSGQEEFEWANHLFKETKFDLIVSGDNHKTFISKQESKRYGNRYLINAGSLMRSTINQIDHKPCIYIFDTEKREAKQYLIPIKPIEEIMNIEKAESERERNKELDAFIEGVHFEEDELEGLNFKKNLLIYIKEKEIEEDVSNEINQIIKGVSNARNN